jgi:hypothetical protein
VASRVDILARGLHPHSGRLDRRNYVPGCNYVSATVTITPGVIVVGPPGSTLMACNEVEAMRMLSSATLTWQITNHVLTIASGDGQKLVIVVRPSIYPSNYPGSPAITIAEGHIGTADYRFYYVPARDMYVGLNFESRGAPGEPWGSSGVSEQVGWTGPQPDWNGGCQPVTIGHNRYLTGWATQDAAKVTVHNIRTDADVDVPLHQLTDTGGLVAYGGFIGDAPRGSTVSIYNADGKLLGKPCPFGL